MAEEDPDLSRHPDGHAHHFPSTAKCIPIGPTVCLSPTVHGDDLHPAGFLFCHDIPGEPLGSPRCVGGVNVDIHFNQERPLWSVVGTLEAGNLTLHPSILCANHPSVHGFVTNGKWNPV